MIIGFAGRGESGKSTAAAYLSLEYGYMEFNFGDPLKLAVAALVGEDPEIYYSQEGKAEIIPWLGITRRKFMQKLGTEGVRDCIDQAFWTKRMEQNISGLEDSHVVIGDVRFKNEAKLIKDMGGVIILLKRDGGFDCDHPSEKMDFEVDTFINNNGDLVELFLKLDLIVKEAKRK